MSAINFRSIATNTALRTILSKLAEIMDAERKNQREALGELSDRMRHLRGRCEVRQTSGLKAPTVHLRYRWPMLRKRVKQ